MLLRTDLKMAENGLFDSQTKNNASDALKSKVNESIDNISGKKEVVPPPPSKRDDE